ncbi:MAG: hypothetical protein II789_00115, partial [Clostridia bacterium]|nr:hypothetical protein [Clostridia bacterium]
LLDFSKKTAADIYVGKSDLFHILPAPPRRSIPPAALVFVAVNFSTPDGINSSLFTQALKPDLPGH